MADKKIQLIHKELTEQEIMKSAWARDLAWVDFVEYLPENHTASPKIYDSFCKEWEIEMKEYFIKQRKIRSNESPL